MSKLTKLFSRNREWAESITKEDPDFFLKLSKQQKPKYLWIGCSDSRVPANQIMGLNPGDIFVHRNIANVVVHSDLNCLSVIQYAVDILKVTDIIVCGHYGCGGVASYLSTEDSGFIGNWLQNIGDVHRTYKEQLMELDGEEKVDRLCELNAKEQVINVCQSTFVQNAWKSNQELSVHALIYDINDGILKDLDTNISSLEALEKFCG